MPTSKVDKLRLASKIVWLIGTCLTINFFFETLKPNNLTFQLGVIVASFGIQYVFTLSESAVIENDLPLPWTNWDKKVTFVWIGAMVCLLVDVLFNVGGAGYLFKAVEDSNSSLTLKENFGANSAFITIVVNLLIIALSIFFALGSEILNAQADLLEKGLTIKPKTDILKMSEHSKLEGILPRSKK